ncbi:MAG TPA: glycoside hydrolase family 31 protein [Propionibacteriaceae bacterium]|nr:glycoside hydrolase family 31 protein [Propionibacteriaceae bacterium]
MLQTEHFVRFERVSSVAETDHGLLAEVHTEQLRIDLIRPDLLRVKMSRGGVFDESPTYAVCVDPLVDPVAFDVVRDPDRVLLVTSDLVVSLWLDPFRLDVHRSDGTAVVETAADDEGRYWAYATLNDAFTIRRSCRQEDAIFGLGEKGGRHNRKGRDFILWNTDVLSAAETAEFTADKAPGDPRGDRTSADFDPFYVTVPFFYHQRQPAGAMAGSFLDNGFRGTYEFSSTDEYRITFSGGQYTEYIFAGPRMPEILRDYTWLTGRMSLPPLWALGYHQCRWHDYTQETFEAVGQRHRDEAIPCDTLWLDIEYMDGYRVFTWNGERFPDPTSMLERLAGSGFRVITIIDPGVKYDPGYQVFDSGREHDVFCLTEGGDTYIGQVWPGNTAFPDFTTKEARDWWGKLNADHVKSGLAGIWNDMNEPATGTISSAAMRFGHGQHSHAQFHNQYALLMAMGTTAGLLESMPDLRTFVLSRAGFAGIQRYAANWMGDNLARWDHLEVSMPMAAGFGVSGQPFVGADIGGFLGNTDAELFLRWMQYGTLTPFCRNHSVLGTVDQYAWSFGPVVQGLVRDAIALRYRLLPYLYAAFVHAAETGAPVQRPLVFDYQEDRSADLDDQFLLGPDLLVAPVTEPKMTSRQVYLPSGDWYDWHTGDCLGGGRFVIAPTPMDRIPVYARGGAVVPMWPDAPPSTAGHHPEVVELHLFVPRTDGTHTSLLVEDDGLTFAAQQGAWYRSTFTVTREGGLLQVRAAVQGNGYPEFRRQAFLMVVHGATPDRLRLDGAEVTASDGGFLLSTAAHGFVAELDL